MISRKSAKLLAEAFHSAYTGRVNVKNSIYGGGTTRFEINKDRLYDYLFEKDYAAYFLNLIKELPGAYDTRALKEFLMKLHTGESLVKSTQDWTWENRQKLGQRYLKDLSADIIRDYETVAFSQYNKAKDYVHQLKLQLELDGYIYKDGTLYQVDSSVIDEQEEQSYLETLIDKLSLSDKEVIKHHIKNAEEHYVNKKWDDSIANSRKFFEAILAQVAGAFNLKKYKTNLSSNKLSHPFEIRNYLENEKLIETKEKEAIAKVYGLLSGTGSHPYIAEKDQARLMWHLALTFSQFVLLRYEGYLKSNP